MPNRARPTYCDPSPPLTPLTAAGPRPTPTEGRRLSTSLTLPTNARRRAADSAGRAVLHPRGLHGFEHPE